MEVELYLSDAFTAKKEELLSRFSSEYRFEKGDELYIAMPVGCGMVFGIFLKDAVVVATAKPESADCRTTAVCFDTKYSGCLRSGQNCL